MTTCVNKNASHNVFDVIYQTRKTVFDNIFKHREVENTTRSAVFGMLSNTVLGV